MKKSYYKRVGEPLWEPRPTWHFITEGERLLRDGEALRSAWRLSAEAEMWAAASCRLCRRPAHWIGTDRPFGDGQEYFVGSDAWCYWCFPSELLKGAELRLRRRAEWARKVNVGEVAEIVKQKSSQDVIKLSCSELIRAIEANEKPRGK